MHMCTVSKDIGINKEKEMSVQQRTKNGHICEQTTMVAKCKVQIGLQ